MPNVFALIPQFTMFRSNEERALYDFFERILLRRRSSLRGRAPSLPKSKTLSPTHHSTCVAAPAGIDTHVMPLVHLLIAVFNNLAISGAITDCTHGVTHITPPEKFSKISTLAKRGSLVLIFLGISTGDVIYSIDTRSFWY